MINRQGTQARTRRPSSATAYPTTEGICHVTSAPAREVRLSPSGSAQIAAYAGASPYSMSQIAGGWFSGSFEKTAIGETAALAPDAITTSIRSPELVCREWLKQRQRQQPIAPHPSQTLMPLRNTQEWTVPEVCCRMDDIKKAQGQSQIGIRWLHANTQGQPSMITRSTQRAVAQWTSCITGELPHLITHRGNQLSCAVVVLEKRNRVNLVPLRLPTFVAYSAKASTGRILCCYCRGITEAALHRTGCSWLCVQHSSRQRF